MAGLHLTSSELAKALRRLDDSLKWDIVQLILDLVGIADQSGAADITNALISLCRGDYLGAAASAVSVVPFGDLAKASKLPRMVRSLKMVLAKASRDIMLAKALVKPMHELRSALGKIQHIVNKSELPGSVRLHLDELSAEVDRFLKMMRPIERFGVDFVARKNGSVAEAAHVSVGAMRVTRVTVNDVIAMLVNTRTSRNASSRLAAEDLLGKMALSDGWSITKSVHKTSPDYRSGAGFKPDRSNHITIHVSGVDGGFHLRVNGEGVIYQITH